MTSTTILGLSHFSLSNSSLVEVDVEMCSIANILSLRQKRSAKLTYIVEKDATEKMRRFSAKSPRGFIGALSFTIKSPFLQILSTESTESKIKTMPEILAPRSFKWYMVCSCTMLSSWENPIQTSALQSINILVIFRKKSKTLISQQLSWAGKFSPWFCDPLGPTHHLIPLTQNRYVEVVLWEMDQLLNWTLEKQIFPIFEIHFHGKIFQVTVKCQNYHTVDFTVWKFRKFGLSAIFFPSNWIMKFHAASDVNLLISGV